MSVDNRTMIRVINEIAPKLGVKVDGKTLLLSKGEVALRETYESLVSANNVETEAVNYAYEDSLMRLQEASHTIFKLKVVVAGIVGVFAGALSWTLFNN